MTEYWGLRLWMGTLSQLYGLAANEEFCSVRRIRNSGIWAIKFVRCVSLSHSLEELKWYLWDIMRLDEIWAELRRLFGGIHQYSRSVELSNEASECANYSWEKNKGRSRDILVRNQPQNHLNSNPVHQSLLRGTYSSIDSTSTYKSIHHLNNNTQWKLRIFET